MNDAFERCERPVTMDNLLCVGGCANGERADIPSNQTIVHCAERTRLHVRKRNDEPLNLDSWFRHDEYRRRWFRRGRFEPQQEVLVRTGTSDQEADYLLRELHSRGINP